MVRHDNDDPMTQSVFPANGDTYDLTTNEKTDDDLPAMTQQEAIEYDKAILQAEAMKRIRLYFMWKQGGWRFFFDNKGVQFQSFEDYCERRIDVNHDTAYKWCQQVETTLHARGWKPHHLWTMSTDEIEKGKRVLLPQTVTRVLHTLPTAALRRQAYRTMEDLKTSQTMTDREFDNEWKRLVKRLKSAEPEPAIASTCTVDAPQQETAAAVPQSVPRRQTLPTTNPTPAVALRRITATQAYQTNDGLIARFEQDGEVYELMLPISMISDALDSDR